MMKLHRLKGEVAELEREITAGPSRPQASSERVPSRKSVLPPKDPVDLIDEIASLRDRLDAFDMPNVGMEDWNTKFDRIGDEGGAQARLPIPQVPRDTGQLSDLDKRLATLEDLVGQRDSESDHVSHD